MKKLIVFCLLILGSSGAVYSQINPLKKLKKEANNVKKDDDKSETKNGSTAVSPETKKDGDKSETKKPESNSNKINQQITEFDKKLEQFYKEYKTEYYDILSEKYKVVPNHDNFEKLKADYASVKPQDPALLKMLENGDNYFNEFFPKTFVPGMKAYVYARSMFDSTKWMNEPEVALRDIDFTLSQNYLTGAGAYSKNDDWIQEIISIYTNQKAKITEYKKNGGVAAHREKLEIENAKKVFPEKSTLSDPEIVAFVKKSHKPDYYGVIQKVIVITDWKIRKDKLDYPIEKYKAIQIVTKKDGKCYLIDTTVYMEHEGGGKYGTKKLSQYLNNVMMSCENAK